MLERRSFLRGLAALPLIGGGVTLIGDPTAAAVPVTDALHARYVAWLAHEHRAALQEHARRMVLATWTPGPNSYDRSAQDCADRVCRDGIEPMFWFPGQPDIERIVTSAPASSRAAVMLSAAGVPLGGVS